MKKIMLILAVVMMALNASATNYDKLWKEVNKSEQKDQPRSSLALLKDIISKATQEKAYGELLAAKIKYANIEGIISADSLQHHIDMLKVQGEAATDPVLRAVTYAVLAYSNREHAEEYYDKALANPDLLAATDASAYQRIISKGSDDDVFNNDMLSVIGNTAKRYDYLKGYYLNHGNRRAACIELYKKIQVTRSDDDDLSRTHRQQQLQEAMKDYSGVPECALFAQLYYDEMSKDDDISDATRYAYLKDCIARYSDNPYCQSFKNKLSRLTQARLETSTTNTDLNHDVVFNVRNIKNVRIDFWRLKADGTTDIKVNTDKEIKEALKLVTSPAGPSKLALDGDVAASVTRQYNRPEYEEFRDTVNMPDIPVGVYLAKITADELTKYSVIYKSDLALLHQEVSKNVHRIAVVSATTGMPIKGATVVLTNENLYRHEVKGTVTLTSNENGETSFTDTISPNYVYVYTATDKAFRKTNYNGYFYIADKREDRDIITVMTDRAIYRPGQKLQGSVIVHNALDEDSIYCVANKKVFVTLHNDEYEEVYKDSVVTDEFGNAGFYTTLPKDGRNGYYFIECSADKALTGRANISVEEYKRPTFNVTSNEKELTKKTYAHGDSVTLRFHAETLTKLPVQNAQVVYSIKRQNVWFWYCYHHGKNERTITLNDTLHTDANGDVAIPLSVSLPEEGYGRFAYNVSVKVTDAAGETHEESCRIVARRADNRYADTRVKEPVFKVSADEFPRDGGPVTLTIKPFAQDQPTNTQGQRVGEQHSGMHPTANTFIYCTIITKKDVSPFCFTLKDSVYTKKLYYNNQWGETGRGLKLSIAFVRNGKVYTFEKTIRKPRPDLKLKTSWATFRDRTQPGNKETWTLRVENGKWKIENEKSKVSSPLPLTGGAGGGSALSATIFDSSLDLLRKLSWSVDVLQGDYYVSCPWRSSITSSKISCYLTRDYKRLKEQYITLALLNSSIDRSYGMKLFDCVETTAAPRLMAKSNAMTIVASKVRGIAAEGDDVQPEDEMKLADDAEPEVDLSSMVRTNLGETAYFTPSLVADKDGNLNISFTMPETMTTWRFLGLAHDRHMRYDIIDTTCVATKDIIVKPNVPRFLRENDRSVLSATVSNTTAKPIDADVIMQFINPTTEKVVWQKTEKVTIAANSSVSVAQQAPAPQAPQVGGCIENDSAIIYRVVAKVIAPSLQGGQGESLDGEQHLIPVLPEMQTVTTTVAFTQHEPGTYTHDISDLLYKGSTHRKLTLQYVEHAVQMILDAVPTTVKAEHNDALCLATAAYVMNLFNIADTAKVVDRLTKLQNTDGSWSWWEGMDGSVYVTTAVSKLLARLLYQGHSTTETEKLLSNAMPFLMDYISKEADRLREYKKKYPKSHIGPSDLAIDILYINALQAHPLTPPVNREGRDMLYSSENNKDIRYLITLLEKIPTELTIYGKAHSASVLALYGKTKKAKEFLESMKQYSVYTPEAGRYYDSGNAYYSWRNYRIPSEVAAMEAIRLITPHDTTTIEEMQRWLLHEKRTQRWDTSVNTADAIYAFLAPSNSPKGEGYNLIGDISVHENSEVKKEEIALPADNIYKKVKTTQGTSWGALYIEQRAPLSSITSTGSGFTVKREIISTNSKDQRGHVTPPLEGLGEVVTVRITIKADRDYDLVTVNDNRPACLEPVNQLSGYTYVEHSGTAYGSYSGCYREMKDNQTNYYFDRLAKGTHVIETDYYIDRQGTYNHGTCTVKCEYAPEFSGVYNTQDKMVIERK